MDTDATPQRFPLQRLIRRIGEVAGDESRACEVRRARGFGERVNALDERLDSVEAITVPLAELEELSRGTEEWFYDLDATLLGTSVRFGLHDSAALFLEGTPSLVAEVVRVFDDARPARAQSTC